MLIKLLLLILLVVIVAIIFSYVVGRKIITGGGIGKELQNIIDEKKPKTILLVGRSGVGKSYLSKQFKGFKPVSIDDVFYEMFTEETGRHPRELLSLHLSGKPYVPDMDKLFNKLNAYKKVGKVVFEGSYPVEENHRLNPDLIIIVEPDPANYKNQLRKRLMSDIETGERTVGIVWKHLNPERTNIEKALEEAVISQNEKFAQDRNKWLPLGAVVYVNSDIVIGGKLEKYYYHGSRDKIEKLEPRPSGVINGESAVFATSSKEMALIFIPKWTDIDLEMGTHNGRIYIVENIPGTIEEKFNTSGYLHYVDAKHFHSDKRLGLQNLEFISDGEVPVIKCESIQNVYKELVKSKKVAFITHSEKIKALAPLMKKVSTFGGNDINKKIIIHISGPSGSGKTTLGNKLRVKFGQKIIVKDIDDLRLKFVNKFYDGYDKFYKNKLKWNANAYQKYIDDFINKQTKPIVFVGLNHMPWWNKDLYYNMHADYKFYIKLDSDTIFKQRCERLIDDIFVKQKSLTIKNIMKDKTKHIKKIHDALNGECDYDETKNMNKIWDNAFAKQGYKFLSRENIFNEVQKILN